MIPQHLIERHGPYLLDGRCDRFPTVWETADGQVVGPFLIRQAPWRLVLLDDYTTLAIFAKFTRDAGVNLDPCFRAVSGRELVEYMGNKFFTDDNGE